MSCIMIEHIGKRNKGRLMMLYTANHAWREIAPKGSCFQGLERKSKKVKWKCVGSKDLLKRRKQDRAMSHPKAGQSNIYIYICHVEVETNYERGTRRKAGTTRSASSLPSSIL
jgi:hypothetical protein